MTEEAQRSNPNQSDKLKGSEGREAYVYQYTVFSFKALIDALRLQVSDLTKNYSHSKNKVTIHFV